MELNIPTIDPLAMMRDYRANYVNLQRLLLQGTGVPAGVKVATPAEQPIGELNLPSALGLPAVAFRIAWVRKARRTI
jgi:hypothetical protein